MLKLAVVGKDVSQSDSPAIHAFLLGKWGKKCTYDKISIPPSEFSARAEELLHSYDGLNVTIPFKAEILPFLRELHGEAKVLRAVNTVVCGERAGYNTDGWGFLRMLGGEDWKNKRVLVLGAGGAGRSCISALHSEGAEVFAYERDKERLSTVMELGGIPMKEVPAFGYDVIVNCTGIGMHDTVGMLPSVRIEREGERPASALFEGCKKAVDLIYVPARSAFLRAAEERNIPTVNGASMLFYQAYLADCIFIGKSPDADEARALYCLFTEERI